MKQMKNLSRLLAAWVLAATGPAQALAQPSSGRPPFVQEGKVWEVERTFSGWGCTNWGGITSFIVRPDGSQTIYYTMRGDTLIDGRSMKKVFKKDLYEYGDGEDRYYAAVREDGSLVYIVYSGQDDERVLYDFRSEGERRDISFEGQWNHSCRNYPLLQDFTVTRQPDEWPEEDAVVINGISSRRYNSVCEVQTHNYPAGMTADRSGEMSHDEEILTVEGIGFTESDPFDISVWGGGDMVLLSYYLVQNSEQYVSGKYDEVPNCTICSSHYVNKVYIEDKCIASRQWELAWPRYPIDPTQIRNVSPEGSGVNSLFDLQGRRLDHEPSQGLYIKDGRKVLKR